MTASHEVPTQKYPSGPEVGWWMGRLSELIRLGAEGEIPLHHNPVSTPVGACPLAGALMYTSVIRGCLPLIHGPMGCANTYRVLFNFWPPVMGMAVPNFLSTAMNEEDVIYGAEDKLRKAIRATDQVVRPELIAVLSSCASGIIGDSLESVCQQVQGEVQARLIWVATEGFSASYWGSAIDKVLMALVDRVMEAQPERDPYGVNVLGEKFADLDEFAYRTDTTELRQLLEAIGLRVCANLTGGATVEEIRQAPRASLNVVRCAANAVGAARHMEERFGTPWVVGPVPHGLRATSEWLRAVGSHFGGPIQRQTEELITDRERWAREQVAPLLPLLQGKRAAVFAGPGRAPSLAALCADLGMEVVYLSMISVRGRSWNNLKWFHETYGQDPEIIIEASLYEDEAVFSRLRPDIFLCDVENIIHVLGKDLPTYEDMIYLPPHMGYLGFVQTARRLALNLNSPILRKGHLFRPPFLAHPDYVLNCHLAQHPAGRCCQHEARIAHRA